MDIITKVKVDFCDASHCPRGHLIVGSRIRNDCSCLNGKDWFDAYRALRN